MSTSRINKGIELVILLPLFTHWPLFNSMNIQLHKNMGGDGESNEIALLTIF